MLQNAGILRVALTHSGWYAFATKLQAGSTAKTKDSAGRRLGVKKFGSEEVFPADILIRQRGFRWKPGKNTYSGKDHTIHSRVEGKVFFERLKPSIDKRFKVHVIPQENPNRLMRPPPPYCYHSELFPELAKNNPQPVVARQKERSITPPQQEQWYSLVTDSKYSKSIELPSRKTQQIAEKQP